MAMQRRHQASCRTILSNVAPTIVGGFAESDCSISHDLVTTVRAAPLLSLFVDVVARSPSVGLPHEQDTYRKAEAANDQVCKHCTHTKHRAAVSPLYKGIDRRSVE